MIDKIKHLIEKEIESIKNIPVTSAIIDAVDCINMAVHIDGGKVCVSGLGKAGQIGNNIATTLSSTGTPAVFIHPSEAQHGDLGLIQKNDIVILISNSGKTDEIIKFRELVRNLYPDMCAILIVGKNDNVIDADVIIETGYPEEICPLGLTPTTSTTVMTVIGDILVVLLIEKIGFTKEDYAKRHHGGYLYKKATTNI
jgi:arabinose-5-phosphate isomerase